VNYIFDASVGPTDRSKFKLAVDDYNKKTCIRWIERSGQRDYVNIMKDDSLGCSAVASNCYSGAGTVGKIRFGHCSPWETLGHEMGHVLCFGHEHNRNDRENYLRPGGGMEGKYEHLNFGHLYDYTSAMNGCGGPYVPSMSGVDVSSCGSKGLSVLDAEKLNDVYQCPGKLISIMVFIFRVTCFIFPGCQSYRFRFPSEIPQSKPFVAGAEASGKLVYSCRAYINGHIMVGKAVGNLDGSGWACWLPYSGSEVGVSTGFEVLTNPSNADLWWWKGGSRLPTNAIAGGRTATRETLYVARCRYQSPGGGVILVPGVLYQSRPDRMHFSYGGREITCTDFDLLVCAGEV